MEPSSRALPARGSGERRVARGAVRAVALLAVPVVGAAAVVAGMPGVVGAVIGLGFVLVLFGASAWMLARAVERGQRSAMGVLVGGAVARLMLYAAALMMLSNVEGIHRPSLAWATAAAMVVTLAYELRLLARTPQLFWVETEQQGASNP